MSTVCSKWAEGEPSAVTTVQPSESVFDPVAAEVDHRFDREGHAGLDLLAGALAAEVRDLAAARAFAMPTPWPTISRTTLKPWDSTKVWIACGDVADAIADLRLLDAEIEGLAGDAEQFRDARARSRRREP